MSFDLAARPVASPTRPSDGVLTGKILVVDDTPDVRRMIENRLKHEGHETHVAQDGMEALERIAAEPFDLVLLDVNMPRLDGHQVLESMRAAGQLHDLPVVVLSAVEDIASVAKCIALGAEDFIAKPFKLQILRARVSNALEKKRLRDQEHRILEQLRAEQQRNEHLLHNIFPDRVVEQLRRQEITIGEHFEQATILFVDIVGFTALAERLSPEELVGFLSRVFSTFDAISAKHGVEKIKTIGDAYLAAAGVPVPREDHAQAMAEVALDMHAAAEAMDFSGIEYTLSLRMGIATGPVVAGVIGQQKFSYDLWGDTVNVASRLESHGSIGQVQICARTEALLRKDYVCEDRGPVMLKGKGKTRAFWLRERRHRPA